MLTLHNNFDKWIFYNDKEMVMVYIHLLLQSAGVKYRGRIRTTWTELREHTGIDIRMMKLIFKRLAGGEYITYQQKGMFVYVQMVENDMYEYSGC